MNSPITILELGKDVHDTSIEYWINAVGGWKVNKKRLGAGLQKINLIKFFLQLYLGSQKYVKKGDKIEK